MTVATAATGVRAEVKVAKKAGVLGKLRLYQRRW
jgi:hypothetical protein